VHYPTEQRSETYDYSYIWGARRHGEALNQALELAAGDITARKPSWVRKTTALTLWRSQPSQWNVYITGSLLVGAVGAPTTFNRTASTNRMKMTTCGGFEMTPLEEQTETDEKR
jgi:hypothetical protein